jgi:hypothetical protein
MYHKCVVVESQMRFLAIMYEIGRMQHVGKDQGTLKRRKVEELKIALSSIVHASM